MWGKLNQIVSGDQQKIESLETQLEAEQQRNKAINDHFKKLLREKDKEIQSLKTSGSISSSSNVLPDDREEIKEELMRLRRKLEEYQTLNLQKDENIQILMQQVLEAEELKDKVEAQERINSEKLMFELAGRIEAHEKISNKLEEMRNVMGEKDIAVQNMADEMAAKDQLLKTKEEAVKRLKVLTQGSEASEQLIESLENDKKELTKEVEKLVGKIKVLEKTNLLQKETTVASHKDERVTQLQDLVRKLESESKIIHNQLEKSSSKIEELQKLLEESEEKSSSLELQNIQLNTMYKEKTKEMENLFEKFKLKEEEASLFEKKYKDEAEETNKLKDQINQLGAELTKAIDFEKSSNDSLKNNLEFTTKKLSDVEDRNRELLNELDLSNYTLQKFLEFEKDNSKAKLLHQDKTSNALHNIEKEALHNKSSTQESIPYSNEESKKSIDFISNKCSALNEELEKVKMLLKEADTKNEDLENQLSSARLEISKLKLEFESAEQDHKTLLKGSDIAAKDLAATQKELELKSEKCIVLEKQLLEKDQAEKMLCLEIEDHKSECVALNKAIRELETVILKLDDDILGANNKLSIAKMQEDSLNEILKAKTIHISEMEKALGVFVKNVQKDYPVENENFVEVLNILECERIELELALKNAIKDRDIFQENNARIESLLAAEKEKFSQVLSQVNLLKSSQEISEKEMIEVTTKLTQEIEVLKSMLSKADHEKALLLSEEKSMNQRIIQLEMELVAKKEQIDSLTEKSENLTAIIDDINDNEDSKCHQLIEQLNLKNNEIQKIKNEKSVECEQLKKLLTEEHKTKAMLEDELHTLHFQIETLQQNCSALQNQLYDFNSSSTAQAVKELELTQSIELLTRELQLKTKDYEILEENLQKSNLEKNVYIEEITKQLNDISNENKIVKDELKTAIKTANDNLKERNDIMAELCTKEETLNKLISDIECLQQKINVLSNDKLKLELEIREKNDLVEITNANLRSKEDTVKSMLEQIELLQTDLFLSKKDLEKLLLSTNEKDLYFESLKTTITEQKEVIERLKEEITNTEVSYQNDLREANGIYTDLQKQFERVSSSEAALQLILFEKETVFENKLVHLSTTINEYEEMITNLKVSLQSKSESLKLLELKIQEKTDDYESLLKQKNKEVDELLHLIRNTNDTVDVLHQEKHDAAFELDVKKSKLAQVSTQMQELMQKLENLQSQNDENELVIEKLNLALTNCENEKKNLKMSFNLKEEEFAMLVIEISALKETQNELNLLLKLEEDKVLTQHNEVKSLKEELENFRFERENIEKLLQLKENEIVALTLSLSNLKSEHEEKLNELLLNISKQEVCITSLNAELQKYNDAQEIWDQEQEYLRNIISTKESDCYQISEDLEKCHQTCHQLNNEYNELKLILENNQNAFNKNQEYIATLQLELKEKLHQITEMEISLKASEDHYFRIESELKSREKHYSGVEKDLKVSEERYSKIEKDFKISLESCSKFESELKVREEIYSNIESDLKISKEQYSNLENDLKLKEVYCSNIEKELIISKEHCSKVETDLKFFKERCSNFERELKEYEAFKVLNQEKILDLEQIIDGKSVELLSVKQMLNNLMSQMQQVQFEKESGNQIISELQTALRGKTNDFEVLSRSFEKLKVDYDQFFLHKKSEEKLESYQQNATFSVQNEQLNENIHISKINELSNALELKEIELKQIMELLNKREQSLSLVEVKCNELNTELISLEEVLKIKDDELLNLEKVNRNLTNDYDSLKVKTARILKKSQTTKKDLAEKQNELESVLKIYTASEKKLIELNICYEQLQKEQQMNLATINFMKHEIVTLKEVQDKEDKQLNDSSVTELINPIAPSEMLIIPSCDQSLMSCSKVFVSEPLLESSDIGLQQVEIKELDSAEYPGMLIKSDSLSLETETVAEEFITLTKSKNDEILELKSKIEDLNNVNKKIKKKYKLMKKAEILLSNEIKDKSSLWHHENEELNKEILRLKQLLESSNNEKILLASKNEKILNLMAILGEDNEDFESLRDFINKSLKSSKDIDLLHNANLRLQDKYDCLENEHAHKIREIEILQADMQTLISEKVQQKEEILNLQNEVKKLSALSCVLNENIEEEKSNMKLSERMFNEQEKLLAPEEYESIKKKVYEENFKMIEEKFNKEKVQILESSAMENAEFRKSCLKENEVFAAELRSTYESEIQSLNNQIIILQKKVEQVLLENTLNDNTEIETTVKNIEPETAIKNIELETNVKNMEPENEISDVIELKRALNSAIAKQQEAEYIRDCEKLLKEQYFSEISILKEEAVCLKKELTKTQSVYDEIESIKQHKDLIIKKLKLKLKQTIAEKASLNDSISSITELSAELEEKEAQIQNLKNDIFKANFQIACSAEEVKKVLEIASNEHEKKFQQVVTEYKTYIQEKENEISDLNQQVVKYKELLLLQNTEMINHNSEKDELIATLKEESIWLQDSMVALHQKADKYDVLAQENHELKQQIQKKNEEITHIREILTLKDNELSYLSEQERLNREELSSELNKMSISLENKDIMLKNISDKACYLQSQVIDLTSKSEHLESTVADFANVKEALDEERNTHEGYLKEVEEIIIGKDCLIDNLKIDCNFYEEQVRTLLKGKDEAENLKKQLDELKEILKNKEDQLSQASDSLKTREGQLSNLRSEIVQRDQMIVDLQGFLQTKEVEMESSKSIVEVKETIIKQLNESVTLSNDSLETERSKAFAMLREKNLEIQEMSDKIKELETILNQQKFAHDQLLNYQYHETLDSEKSACEESFEESSRTLEELQMLRGLLEGNEQDIFLVNFDSQKNYNENIKDNLCINQNLIINSTKNANVEKKECDLKEKVEKNFLNPQLVLESTVSSSTPIKNDKMLNVSVIDIPFKSLSNNCETSVTTSTLYDQESESGWEISEDVISASNESEQVPNADLGLMKQVEDLIDNIEKLSAIKERKENVIAKLKLKLKRNIEEKDQLKQEAKSASKLLVDIANLQEELEMLKQENISLKAFSLEQNNSVFEIKKQLEQVKEHKDKVITKLKVKVKQTIKDRDQLSENLQSEIDRLSEEKDLLFNELSQNLREQSIEMQNIEKSNQMLTMMVKSLESKLTENDSAFQELKLSLNATIMNSEKQVCHADSLQKELNSLQVENQKLTETLNEKLNDFVKLQEELKYLQLDNENLKETIKGVELFNEKLKSDNHEKDFQINNFEKLSIQNKLNQESWIEEKTVLEDALRIKEVTLERLLVEHQALQREFLKFKSHYQLSDEQKATEMEELHRKYQANQELLLNYQSKIKEIDKFNIQIEDIKFLFGISDCESTLLDQLTAYKMEIMSKLKEKEEDLEKYDLEIKNSLKLLDDLMKIKLSFNETTSEQKETILKNFNSESLLSSNNSSNLLVSNLHDRLFVLKTEWDKCEHKLGETESICLSLKKDLAKDHEVMESLIKKLKDAEEKIIIKEADLFDAVEENQQLRNELTNIKEQLNEAKDDQVKQILVNESQILKNSISESCLNEKKHELVLKKEEIEQLEADIAYKSDCFKKMEYVMNELETANERLKLDDSLKKDEIANLQSENSNLLKQIDLLTALLKRQPDNLDLKDAVSENNQAFLKLRNNFDDVISQKDSVNEVLHGKLNGLNADTKLLHSNELDIVSYAPGSDTVSKSQYVSLQQERDFLKEELNRVTNENNLIGGNRHNLFDNISSGLRSDVELALKERREYETSFKLTILELELKLKSCNDEINSLSNSILKKERLLNEKDCVITELKSRVEIAAEILSKKKYYENIESHLLEADSQVAALKNEKCMLDEELSLLKLNYDSLKLDFDLLSNEVKQIKLHTDGKVEEALLSKAEEVQNLRNAFDLSMAEKDEMLNLLQERLADHDLFVKSAVDEEHNKLTADMLKKEEIFKEKINTLERRLSSILAEKEQQVCLIPSSNNTVELQKLQKDFHALIEDKDKQINDISSQLSQYQDRINELQIDRTLLQTQIKTLQSVINDLEHQNHSLKSLREEMINIKSSEIDQLILSKSKQLKDLRVEFESVFYEKNVIIEEMRAQLKKLSSEQIAIQNNLREMIKQNNIMEQSITDSETEKIELDAQLNLLMESLKNVKAELLNEKNEKQNLKEKVAQMLDAEKLPLAIDGIDRKSKNLQGNVDKQEVNTDEKLFLANSLPFNSDTHHNEGSFLENNETPYLKSSEIQEFASEISIVQNNKSSEFQKIRSLEQAVSSLKMELLTLRSAKERAEEIMQEKYQDIFSNLREDLDNARRANTALQEDNFSLKNQIDVFTNVDAKRLGLLPGRSLKNQSMPDVGTILPVSLHSKDNDSILEQSFDKSPIKSDIRLEFIESAAEEQMSLEIPLTAENSSKKHVLKLKKLCRKYKNEAQESKDAVSALTVELSVLKEDYQTLVDSLSEDRIQYEKQIQNLREEINELINGKTQLAASLKANHEQQILALKDQIKLVEETYQLKVSKLKEKIHVMTQEIVVKDAVITANSNDLLNADKELKASFYENQQNLSKLNDSQTRLDENQKLLHDCKEEILSMETRIKYLVDENLQLTKRLEPSNTMEFGNENPEFDKVEVSFYQQSLMEYQLELSKARTEISKAREENCVMADNHFAEKRDLTHQFNEMQTRIEQLLKENLDKEIAAKSLREEISANIEEKSISVYQWKAKHEQSVMENEEMRVNFQNEVQLLNDELAHSQEEVVLLNDTIFELDDKVRLLEEERHQKISLANRLAEELQLVKHEKEYTYNLNKDLEIELEVTKKRVESLTKQITAHSEAIAKKEIDLVSLQENCEKYESSLQTEKSIAQLLKQDVTILQQEKLELEGRIRREIQQAWDDMVVDNNNYRREVLKKEKSNLEIRHELETLMREKEFFASALRGQLSETSSIDAEYLRLQVALLQREKNDSSDTFDQICNKLNSEMDNLTQKNAALNLRLVTLRAMLEQEVKDHEKTKIYKEQLVQHKTVSFCKLKQNVSKISNDMKLLRKDTALKIDVMKDSFQQFAIDHINETGASSSKMPVALQNKDLELKDLYRRFQVLQESNQLSELRLSDVIGVLKELNQLKQVKERLLELENRPAEFHKNTLDSTYRKMQQLSEKLLESENIIRSKDESILVLENDISYWRKQYADLKETKDSSIDQSISSENNQNVPGFSPFRARSVELEPTTPKMQRN